MSWYRGYKAGRNPLKKHADNPYKWHDEPVCVFFSERLEWYSSAEHREAMTYVEWNNGFDAGRKYLAKMNKKAKAAAVLDEEYELYANLGEELSGGEI